ncbi:MAG: VWA domain-containing protein [Methanofollis sp.]|uniref:VWA domain-containing protein n=1 Tax=Methanofollis sp. TaxID=2052835 RepID=UPI002611DDD3|nr:VWA domain-containing protein [Methanofollis sp.]MDD4254786.1 VWA domain-containing protein [Methanofollis sp.]
MRISYYGIVLLGVLMLCSASAAADTQISLSTDTEWLVAGSGGTSNVTVTATGETTVVLTCNSTMGTLSRSTLAIEAGGQATATFTVGEKSGDATITATALNADGTVAAESTVVQKVDHAAPYKLAFRDYTSEATAGSVVQIVLAMEDRFKNRIDNRHEVAEGRDAETVTFYVGSLDNSAVFLVEGNDSGDAAAFPVDEKGNVMATLRLAKKPGENIVYVDLPDPIADAYYTFYGLSNAPPATITCDVSPGGTPLPWVRADGEKKFTLTYTLKDAYGNPSVNQTLLISTNDPEESPVNPPPRSNSDGRIVVTYGPKSAPRTVNITATSKDAPAVTCQCDVEFTSTEPVDMQLTASPQTMSSLDVNPDQTAEIRAKVVDVKGGPVKGQTVTFSLSDNITTGSAPVLRSTSAVTDDDGYATVIFVPGAFPRRGETGYVQNATGTCNVTAEWTYKEAHVTHPVPLAWKNYPYLSVETNVSPRTVTKGEAVDVTIRLKGDGSLLQADPIDVVLAIDRSLSMNKRDAGANMTRMDAAKNAAKTFVSQMNPDRDRIGLVSYGFRVTRDRSLNDPSDVNATVNGIGVIDSRLFTATRNALNVSIGEIKKNPNQESNAVRAVVLMSDGEYNCYGDPLARGSGFFITTDLPVLVRPSGVLSLLWKGVVYLINQFIETVLPTSDDPGEIDARDYTYFWGLGELSPGEEFGNLFWEWANEGRTIWDDGRLRYTNQNMSVYAKNNDIRLYMISFSDDIKENDTTWETMDILAESTGGKHYHATTDDDLARIYTEIAGELQTEAGVNTTMNLNFTNVRVNSTPVRGDKVFEYVFKEGVSTHIHNQTRTGDVLYNDTIDQTPQWDKDQNLHFDIGTVRLGQTWETTFRLKVNETGNITIFGPGSTISFNNGAEPLILPEAFISALPVNNPGNGTADIWVGDLHRVENGPITDFLRMTWNLNYTGNQTATQHLFYSTDEKRTWVGFGTVAPREKGLSQEKAALDVRDLPTARYWIRVRATAPDAPPAENETRDSFFVGNTTDAKIRLQ